MKIYGDGLAGELAKRVNLLLSTPEGTLVFDREYGLDMTCVDSQPEVAEALLLAELEEKLARYEPDVTVQDVVIQADVSGNLYVRVVMANAAEQDEG